MLKLDNGYGLPVFLNTNNIDYVTKKVFDEKPYYTIVMSSGNIFETEDKQIEDYLHETQSQKSSS